HAYFVDAGKSLHAGGDIHVLPEVVDPVVEPHGDSPASVHSDLEAERLCRGLVKSRQFFDHLNGGQNGVLWALEAGHNCISDRLDDGAGSLSNDLVQDVEV